MRAPHAASKWKDEFLLDIYEHAKSGLTNDEIAKALQVSDTCFRNRWMVARPVIRVALERGRQAGKTKDEKAGTLAEYVYAQLSGALRQLWDKLEWAHEMAAGPEKIEAIIGKESAHTRQRLWVHAMLVCDFNQSEACRMVNISKRMLDYWIANDADFPAMVDELHFHKKNFFEGLLVKYSKLGESKLVAMANQTLNRDRGYGKTIAVEHSGAIQHNHLLIPLEKLDLPVDVLLQIEAAFAKLPQPEKPAIPVQALPSPAKSAKGGEDERDGEEDAA